jgi:hypothetical protein
MAAGAAWADRRAAGSLAIRVIASERSSNRL